MALFLAENARLNLSAYRTEEQCWHGNILDSIVGIHQAEFGRMAHVMDLGTGGGFPLLPLAILFPYTRFTGIDATRKKIDAVEDISQKLGLTNVDLVVGRAGELGRNDSFPGQFDFLIIKTSSTLFISFPHLHFSLILSIQGLCRS